MDTPDELKPTNNPVEVRVGLIAVFVGQTIVSLVLAVLLAVTALQQSPYMRKDDYLAAHGELKRETQTSEAEIRQRIMIDLSAQQAINRDVENRVVKIENELKRQPK